MCALFQCILTTCHRVEQELGWSIKEFVKQTLPIYIARGCTTNREWHFFDSMQFAEICLVALVFFITSEITLKLAHLLIAIRGHCWKRGQLCIFALNSYMRSMLEYFVTYKCSLHNLIQNYSILAHLRQKFWLKGLSTSCLVVIGEVKKGLYLVITIVTAGDTQTGLKTGDRCWKQSRKGTGG